MAQPASPHARELLGRRLEVTRHSDPGLVGLSGRVTLETRETLVLTTERGELRIPKRNGSYHMHYEDDTTLELEGRRLTYRPQDRVKRGL